MSAAAKALDALEAAGQTLRNAKDGLAWRIASDELHLLRVNLSAPLAAVALAAMAYRVAVANGGINAAEDDMFAALDALEAAAEGGAA